MAAAAAAAAVAVKQPFCSGQSSSAKESRISCGSVYTGRRRPDYGILSCRFCDQGHLQYYNSKIGCSSGKQDKSTTTEKPLKKMKKKKKKQLKLLKGLTRDLSTFSQIGFGLDSTDALIDQVKGNMISEAAEVLLEQLQKRRAEEKELKRKMKEEKTRLKAAARMQNCVIGEMSSASSSSSSSESSDSECGEVIDMKQVKRANAALTSPQPVTLEEPTNQLIPTITTSVCSSEEKMVDSQLSSSSNVDTKNDNADELSGLTCTKKIEVCMGGKCKKLGGGALLEEFQRAVGMEGVVVSGCKCMGKCRDGPNVKVLNGGGVAADRAPVCVGVDLEDVNMIVADLFGENQKQLEFATAAA